MANLYKRSDSPFYWICYRDAQRITRQESTRLRWSKAIETRKARALVAQRTADELARGTSIRGRTKPVGWSWVSEWLSVRYQASPGTLTRFRNDWKMVFLFIEDTKIEGPPNLARRHCYDYIRWRTAKDAPIGRFAACHNTALHELHVLGIVMQEAVNRELVDANPCLRLGIKKQDVRRKPELTAADDRTIRQNIPLVKSEIMREMLAASFEIARHQGARLNETRLNLRDDINLKDRTITFRTKTRKAHTTSLHPALIPIFHRMISRGLTHTWQFPRWANTTWPAKKWFEFLGRIGLREKGITFHSTRVTVITEMARNNVSLAKAKAFVGHASSTIHSIYQRLQPADLSDCTRAIGRGKRRSA